MGHKRYGYLPKSKIWREIVREMGAYALGQQDVLAIAKNTLSNVQKQYSNFENDPSIKTTFEFLLHIAQAFKQQDPVRYLRENNIVEGEGVSVFKITRAAINYKTEEVASHEYQAFAKQAAASALSSWYKSHLEEGRGFFHEGVDSTAVFRKASEAGGFCELTRLYFSNVTERYLRYFLDREAAIAIPNVEQRSRFSNEIEKHMEDVSRHAFETSKIAQSFAAGWFAKNTPESYPDEREIKYFLNRTFGKLKSELLREEEK